MKEHAMAEEKLGPKNWESMRSLSHHILDDILDYLETLQDRPVFGSMLRIMQRYI
ncbi:MAG: hypothetical protein LUQ44_03530 [Methanothrix sp.]|jgi:hypothetical protein|nr:hypothetical protein [Methanothrix sp.]